MKGKGVMRMAEEKKYKLEQVSVRLKLCEEAPLYSTEQIDTPRRAIDVMKDMLRQLDREYVCIVNLDNGGHPITADYKPLAKVEELEEENYNQIDNYLSNTISRAEEKRERFMRSEVRRAEERPSVRARLREGKAKMEAEKQQKAMMTRQRKTEKTK